MKILDNRNREYGLKNPTKKQCSFVLDVWNDDSGEAFGFTRLVRLFLVIQVFIFPNIYIRTIIFYCNKKLIDIVIELVCIIKVMLIIIYLVYCPTYNVMLYISGYLFLETIFYSLSLVFLEDIYNTPRYPKRSMLLLSFNFIEINLYFASLYYTFQLVGVGSIPVQTPVEAFYFSLVTMTTIGYGDIIPLNIIGKYLVIGQSLISLLFMVLIISYFINFWSQKKVSSI